MSMIFEIPETPGIFLPDMSDKLKDSITSGEVFHYLIGDTPTRLRNRIGFHAALRVMIEGFIERALFPYEMCSTLTQEKLDDVANSDFWCWNAPTEFFGRFHHDGFRRQVGIGRDKRFNSWVVWNEIINSIYTLTHWREVFFWSRDGHSSHERPPDVSVHPSVCYLIGKDSSDDISGTDWVIVDSSPSPINHLVEEVTDLIVGVYYPIEDPFVKKNYFTYDLLSTISNFHALRDRSLTFGHPFGNPSSVDFSPWQDTILMLEGEEHLNEGSGRYFHSFSPNGVDHHNTSRPNLSLLQMYQMLLGCFWATWAGMYAWIHIPHKMTTKKYTYTIGIDGSVHEDSVVTETETWTEKNVLRWEHNITSETEGTWEDEEWSYCGDASVSLDLLNSDLWCDEREFDEAYDDAQMEIDNYPSSRTSRDEWIDECTSELVNDDELRDFLLENIPDSAVGSQKDLRIQAQEYGTGVFHHTIAYAFFYNGMQKEDVVSDLISDLADYSWERATWSLPPPETYPKFRLTLGEGEQTLVEFSNSVVYNAYDCKHLLNQLEESVSEARAVVDNGISKPITDIVKSNMSYDSVQWYEPAPHNPYESIVKINVVARRIMPYVDLSNQVDAKIVYDIGGSSPSEDDKTEWPAKVLEDADYVKQKLIAAGAVFYDELHDYRWTEDGYRAGREPTYQNYGKLHVAEINPGQYSAAEELEAWVRDTIPVQGSIRILDMVLPLEMPTPHTYSRAAVLGDLFSGIGEFFAWYHSDYSGQIWTKPGHTPKIRWPEMPPPGDGYTYSGKLCPYRITQEDGEVWFHQSGDTSNMAAFSFYFCNNDYHAKSQSGGAYEYPSEGGEGLRIELSQDIGIRVVWNWKSMPVRHERY